VEGRTTHELSDLRDCFSDVQLTQVDAPSAVIRLILSTERCVKEIRGIDTYNSVPAGKFPLSRYQSLPIAIRDASG
jgi:hypothetical protein